MTKSRALTLGFLASTALAGPAFAQPGQSPAPGTNATDVTSAPPKVQTAQDGNVPDQTEIVITATKREERLQNVPQSVIAIGTRRLDQLNISDFEGYTKQLPSVSYNYAQSGGTVVYMRGVATGGDGNHSGALPSVGVYLDEQPVTTVGGALDVHIYDIARIESLAGPQGTLYGASSEAGTIRIITNKPDLNATYGRVDGELNTVDHGGVGGKLEGMINIPLGSRVAFRGVAFYQRDAGFIDNVPDSRTYCGTPVTDGEEITGCLLDGIHVTNAAYVRNNINKVTNYGGRAALKIDLDDNWTVTPTIMHQNYKQDGFFAYDPRLGDLKDSRFRNEYRRQHFTQAALTVEGKIWNFDVTYAGAYLDHPTSSLGDYTDYTDHYDAYYTYCGGLANCQNYVDASGRTIDPRQYIVGSEHFKKLSQEVRVATPKDAPLRAIFGAFYQRQTNHIFQDYLVDNLGPQVSVNGWPGTIWLTLQNRKDKDYALFGEAEYDIIPKITLIAGARYYRFDNTIIGFNGFGADNPSGSSLGYNRCLTTSGAELRDPLDNSPLIGGGVPGTPCTNVGQVVNGKLEPKRSKGDGFTYRLSGRYKPTKDLMFYATWSKGFRPGGINRQPTAPAYKPDYLYNLEAGWKTSFGALTWNGAIYHQIWKGFQFAFLGPNSLTVIQNGRDAKINGVESDVSYTANGLSLNAAASYTDAKTKGAICHSSLDTTADCSAIIDGDEDYIVTPSGTRLPITPKFKATATARYTWQMGPGKAHVQGSVAYQGSSSVDVRQDPFGDGTNPNDLFGRVKSSTLVDLYLGYDWRNYNLELFASNVFDQRNQLSRILACGACDRVHIIPGRPRTIGVRLGAKF